MNEEIINSTICNSNSIEDMMYVDSLIYLGKYWKKSKNLVNSPMIYILLLEVKNLNNEYLIHISYTTNLPERLKMLKYEYNCKLFFLEFKILNNIDECKCFNKLIKSNYPNLIENI